MRSTANPRRGPDRKASEAIDSNPSASGPGSDAPSKSKPTPDLPQQNAQQNAERDAAVKSGADSTVNLWTSPVAWIASAGGLGYAPVASGTFGSAGAVLLFWGISGLTLPFYALTVLTITVLGIWASDRAESLFANKDDGRIVIDEVAGQLLTLIPVLLLASSPVAKEMNVAVGQSAWWVLVVTGFVVFRLLDIWKPGPVRWAERNFRGGLGVMADDLLAGAFGGILMALPCYGLLLRHLDAGALPTWLS